jgi:hypothetical protein
VYYPEPRLQRCPLQIKTPFGARFSRVAYPGSTRPATHPAQKGVKTEPYVLPGRPASLPIYYASPPMSIAEKDTKFDSGAFIQASEDPLVLGLDLRKLSLSLLPVAL